MPGPLAGTTVLELAGIGPGPFAGMMLADMGADVIVVERPGGDPAAAVGHAVLFRNRRSIAVDLKAPEGAELVRRLAARADGLFEGFRPGVAERLGVGPDACLARNPRLVYGRMTGWGQDGPLASAPGHDIDYIALTGALHAIGRRGEAPVPPLNLVGDFGGGGMLLAFGMVCGLLHAARTGEGQVIDAAMVDGASALMAMWWGLRAQGLVRDERGTNLLDSGAPFYDVYETADGRWVALGALEPRFFAVLCELLDLGEEVRACQRDPSLWPAARDAIAAAIASRTRDEWDDVLLGTDACYAPVLDLGEAPDHPHLRARGTLVDVDGVVQPAPAPRFAATPAAPPRPQRRIGEDTRAVLAEAGLDEGEIARLARAGAIASEPT